MRIAWARARLFGLAMGHVTALVGLTVLVGPVGCDLGARPVTARNVVFISIDTLGAKHVTPYGYERDTTPALARLAERGVLFERAYTQQNWTLTSHITMMTGLAPQLHGASKERPASPVAPTLPEVLAHMGFTTAAFTGVGGFMAPRFGLGRGFDVYEVGRADARSDNRERLAFLEAEAVKQREDPSHRFFLFAHYFDPHSDARRSKPYVAPEPYGSMFLAPGSAWNLGGNIWTLFDLAQRGALDQSDRDTLWGLYDGGVRYADEEGVGPLLDALDRLGLADETLVVVTADHGEELLEHGDLSHKQPYDENARVPLLMAGPGLPSGLRIPEVVSLVDLKRTIVSLVGGRPDPSVQGRDLSALIAGADETRPAFVDGVLGGLPHAFAHYASSIVDVEDGRVWSFVAKVDPVEGVEGYRFEVRERGELYDLDADPLQQADVSADHPQVSETLRGRLLDWYAANERLARTVRPTGAAPRSLLSEEEIERLKALGYAE